MTSAIASSWDNMAKGYAKRRATALAFRTDLPVVMRMMDDIRGKSVLDIGCGGGDYAFKLHEAGASVLGIDPSVEMLRYARMEQERRGVYRGLHFESMDIIEFHRSMGLGHHRAYDRILFGHSLNNIGDLHHVARIIGEISRSDSIMVVTIPHPISTAKVGGSEEVKIEDYLTARTRQESWVLDGETYTISEYHRPLSEYSRFFAEAGYDIAEIAEPVLGFGIKLRNEYDVVDLRRRQKLPSSMLIKGVRHA
jgi:2-polyprenyl-3-methyl-5-hydroxy-6-metoxy-1,4-benzoquinol methylase